MLLRDILFRLLVEFINYKHYYYFTGSPITIFRVIGLLGYFEVYKELNQIELHIQE